MTNFRNITAAVIVGAIATLTLAHAAPAAARDTFSFSFNTGDVAFAYSDGYWDNNRQWHGWNNRREARMYREQHSDNYRHKRHSREHNNGWRRDNDGDGVPNKYDDAPNNPRRQ